MKIKVIEVLVGGKVGYVRSTSIMDKAAIVASALHARNFLIPDPDQVRRFPSQEFDGEKDLEQWLSDLRMPGDEFFAKSGLCVDRAEVVELEVTLQEVTRHTGRQPHRRCVD